MNLEDCVGKTITAVGSHRYLTNKIAISFDTGEVLVLEANGEEGDAPYIDSIESSSLEPYERHGLGLITQAAYDEILANEKRERLAREVVAAQDRLDKLKRLERQLNGEEPMSHDPDAESGLTGFTAALWKAQQK